MNQLIKCDVTKCKHNCQGNGCSLPSIKVTCSGGDCSRCDDYLEE